jgi:hypothetical protein
MSAIMFPRIAYVVTTGCVGCPCFAHSWGDVSFNIASERCKGVCILVVLTPELCIC